MKRIAITRFEPTPAPLGRARSALSSSYDRFSGGSRWQPGAIWSRFSAGQDGRPRVRPRRRKADAAALRPTDTRPISGKLVRSFSVAGTVRVATLTEREFRVSALFFFFFHSRRRVEATYEAVSGKRSVWPKGMPRRCGE